MLVWPASKFDPLKRTTTWTSTDVRPFRGARTEATTKPISMEKTSEGAVGFTYDELPGDVTKKILLNNWRANPLAPLVATVSKTFKADSKQIALSMPPCWRTPERAFA